MEIRTVRQEIARCKVADAVPDDSLAESTVTALYIKADEHLDESDSQVLPAPVLILPISVSMLVLDKNKSQDLPMAIFKSENSKTKSIVKCQPSKAFYFFVQITM